METRSNRFKSYLNTTATTLKSLILPSTIAATTYLSHEAIQTVRAFDASPVKDSLKNNIANISSTINISNIAFCSFEMIQNLVNTGIWNQMSAGQRLNLCTWLAISFGTAGYSIGVFGHEQNTLVGGACAAASVLTLNLANNLTSFFAQGFAAARQADENETPTEETRLVRNVQP